MQETPNALEGLTLISDWAKWLITIETALIAVIAAGMSASATQITKSVKLLVTGIIASFVISIAAAAVLLLSLPEIAQALHPETNIWLTEDSIIGRVFGTNTQGFAVVESFFFGVGIVLFAALIILQAWSSSVPKGR